MSGNLLINEYPLLVLPNLAKEIGLNEAIFIQQLHYWLNGKSAKVKDGKKWVYNTYEDWQEQFPFWSVPTIKRIVSKLREKKLIATN
ncbi:MAG: DNA replication protein DnaD, partial [Atopostipes sp.]|nr:DNA replication protein DnaD [Atopostipes sp.]